jgi:pyruvate/2-oxoglutarate dehydrogenase complex dihydrolipoamide dehydrogenase (E3) component
MIGVRDRKRQMVNDLIEVHRGRYAASGADLIMGEGRFIAPKTLEVQADDGSVQLIAGDRIFLNTGTRAAVPEIPGMAAAQPLTHVEALELDHLPEHLIIIGGGYVGLEFAQAIRRFGSRVTIVQRRSQLAPREDSDVAEAVLHLFADEGIDVLLNSEPLDISGHSGSQVVVRVQTPEGIRTNEGSDILVATGRVPNTAGIGLDLAGVELDDRGYVKVNDRLETTAPDVLAMGDCAGSPQFTHIAYDDFRIVRDNLNGGNRTTRDRLVPYCTFTDPEIGRIGLNEAEAQQSGVSYRLARIPAAAVLRTRTLSETRGFLKALVATDSDRILGFTAFCTGAGELIGVVQVAMMAGLPYTALRDATLLHPTMAEGLTVLFATPPVTPA